MMRFLLLFGLFFGLAIGASASEVSVDELAAMEQEQKTLQERANVLAERLEEARRLEQLQQEYLEKLKAKAEAD